MKVDEKKIKRNDLNVQKWFESKLISDDESSESFFGKKTKKKPQNKIFKIKNKKENKKEISLK